jgi:hypothetical protein
MNSSAGNNQPTNHAHCLVLSISLAYVVDRTMRSCSHGMRQPMNFVDFYNALNCYCLMFIWKHRSASMFASGMHTSRIDTVNCLHVSIMLVRVNNTRYPTSRAMVIRKSNIVNGFVRLYYELSITVRRSMSSIVNAFVLNLPCSRMVIRCCLSIVMWNISSPISSRLEYEKVGIKTSIIRFVAIVSIG